MKNFDVMVIGSGPAGATAARFCANAGLKTAIIEKEKLPREKLCAGGVIPGALRFCGIEIPDKLVERSCNQIILKYKRTTNSVVIKDPIFMVNRALFDMHLTNEAKKSGARLMENEKFLGFNYRPDHIEVSTSRGNYKTKFIIGADGYFSSVRKSIGIGFNAKESPLAIEAKIPMDEKKLHHNFDNKIIISYQPGLKGYLWIFPKKDYLSVGIGTFIKNKRYIRDKFFAFLKEHGLTLKTPIRSWFIPPGFDKKNLYRRGILLTGDAAGFVDSFTGEGIRYAMISGKIAASILMKCFKENNFSEDCLSEYKELCRKFIISNIDYSKKISHYIYGYQWLTMRSALKNKKLLQKYTDAIFGQTSYYSLVKWLKPRLPFIILRGLLPF